MLNIFKLVNNNKLSYIDKNESLTLCNVIWIDLIKPQDEDYKNIKTIFGKNIITLLTHKNITKTQCFIKETNIINIYSMFSFTTTTDNNHHNIVIFIIQNGILFTLRNNNIASFHTYQMNIRKKPILIHDAYTIILNLFEINLNNLSNKIGYMYKTLDELSIINISNQQINVYRNTLTNLANLDNIVWKTFICLLDIQHVMNFLLNKLNINEIQIKQANNILYNIKYLLIHNKSLFKKISFLIQTVMGFINFKQNRVIRIFSVIFLPPTLIASSYGMNFEFMPELKWSFGYPGAIFLMILSGLIPYFYLKHKKWF